MRHFILAIGFIFSLMSFSSVQAELIPALKYKGQILGSNGLTSRACEFYVASFPGEDSASPQFVLGYLSTIHGAFVPPGVADFFYFDPQANSGTGFYPVNQPQEDSLLTISFIELRETSPKFGIETNPNDLATLNPNIDIQTSAVLSFKEGVSFENYVNAFFNLVNETSDLNDLNTVNFVDLMTVSYWNESHKHPERARCAAAAFDSLTMIDFDLPHNKGDHSGEEHADDHEDDEDDHEDHSDHDH